MREIKFRAWDKEQDKIIDWDEGFGNHHPYCKYTYEQVPKSPSGRCKIGWSCICSVLANYDKWRKIKRHC